MKINWKIIKVDESLRGVINSIKVFGRELVTDRPEFRREFLALFMLVAIFFSATAGYYYGHRTSYQFNQEAAVASVEEFFYAYKEYYGQDQQDYTQWKGNEAKIREQFNTVNIPSSYFHSNLTVDEIIIAYDKYQGPASYVLGELLEGVCR